MRNNPLPKDFATNLMPTDDYGKFVINHHTLQAYIEAVLQHLQTNQQNLNIPDFVDAIIQSLDLDLDNVASNGVFTTALNNAVVLKYHPITTKDETLTEAIKEWLMAQDSNYATYSRQKAILRADFPMPSVLNPKKIAVWRSTSKMGDWNRRQAVSVRKWVSSTFRDLSDDQVESLSKRIDELLAPLEVLDVRHHNSYDFDDWERAYTSDKIRSCMHPDSNCEVGYKRTFTCYCSGYHGLPDNGLKLTVLYQDGTPVARAITYTEDEQKYYIRVYGDDRLERWLIEKGYDQADFAAGTILYTTESLLKPYVDGDVIMADHHTTNDGKHYWVLSDDGEYNLQTTDAYAYSSVACECCGESCRESSIIEVESIVDGRYYTVCSSCEERNSYYVYMGDAEPERVFCHDGHSPDTNSGYVEYDGEYYKTDSLGEYGLRLIDDEVYHEDDLYYCELSDEWFTDGEDVYTDAEQISTDQPVHFPYDCVSREYWDENVVETTCGTLALSDDTREISTPALGSVCTLDDYWTIYTRRDGAGVSLTGIIFKLADIERDYEWEPSDKMQAFRDYAIAYNKIQYFRFQELGI